MSIILKAALNRLTKSSRAYYTWLILVILLSALPAFSQNEASNWILGPNTGITFKSGVPQKLPQTAENFPFIRSTISDSEGNLLFYTDGIKVWDRNHQEMPNGKNLKGTNHNVCQIIPKPGDPNRYFIFTTMSTNGWGAPFEAAYYSEVDLCLNGGLGDVVEATRDTRLMSIAGVRTAAVKHSNGTDYWVAFHKWDSDAFYCYQVTKDGVSLSPVISHTGSYLRLTSYSTGDGGEMKFSPNGKKLAIAISQSATAEVFDFDAQTGVLSNPLHIPPMFRQNFDTPDYTFGVEFSPDGQKFYLTRTNGTLLLQYDLSTGDKASILKSRTIIAGDTLQHNRYEYTLYSMQLGPDSKLYISRSGQTTQGVSVIAKPNEKGSDCLYQDDILRWNGGSISRLPTFIASYFNPTVAIKHEFDCFSATVQFSLAYTNSKSNADIANIQWDFDDDVSGASNKSDETSPSHTFMSEGVHKIHASITWTDGTTQELNQLLTVPPDVVSGRRYGLGNDTTLCAGASLKLDASHTGGDITWQDGSKKPYFDVTEPGVYWVRVCKAGCSTTDSITVTLDDMRDFLGEDRTLCEENEIILNVAPIGKVIGWQDNSVSPVYTITKPGTYWVKIQKNNCVFTDSLEVTACDEELFIPNIITPNGDGLNDRFEIRPNDNDSWSLTILDRYGREVYQAKVYRNDWEGAKLMDGTYFYYLHHNLTKKSYKGIVQTVR